MRNKYNIPDDVDGDEYIIEWRAMVDSGELEQVFKYGTDIVYYLGRSGIDL